MKNHNRLKKINDGIANKINGELKIIHIAIQHKINTSIIVKIILANSSILIDVHSDLRVSSCGIDSLAISQIIGFVEEQTKTIFRLDL